MRAVSLAPLFAASLIALLTSASDARAADPAAAQALFDQAKPLMTAGRFAEACPKLEESQRLDPGMGTLFHLADCDEHIGKTASAWAAFLDVAAQARAAGQGARERIARDRAAALEPSLAHMTILGGAVVNVIGLEIRRDGVVIGKGQWAAALPVDPGLHEIRASAPGKIAWVSTVRVDARARETVTLPPLADAPPQAVAAKVEPVGATQTTSALTDTPRAERSNGTAQRALGVTLGVVALAGAGVGTYFLLASKSSRDDSAAHCAGNTCDATGVSLRDDALRQGNIATIAYGAGGAALLGSVILFLTAPRGSSSSSSASVSTRPSMAVSPTGFVFHGAF